MVNASMSRSFKLWKPAAGIIAAVMITVAPALLAEEKPVPTGNLEVKVVFEGGKSMKECRIYARDQKAVLKGNESSRIFAGLSEGPCAVTADAVIGLGFFKGEARYVGVEPVDIIAGKTLESTIILRQVTKELGNNINDFCMECHPNPRTTLKPGQIRRDVHASGKILPPNKVAQVKKYNDKLEKTNKDPEKPPFKIILEEREFLEAGKTVKKIFFTCESCHTLHFKTAYTSYAVASFRDRSDLCEGCHD